MDTVTVCLLNKSQPSMTTYPDGKAVGVIVSPQVTRLDIKDFQDFVFTLGKLWSLDLDRIKNHWTCNLFAGGMVDHGKNVSIQLFFHLSLNKYAVAGVSHNRGEKCHSGSIAVLDRLFDRSSTTNSRRKASETCNISPNSSTFT